MGQGSRVRVPTHPSDSTQRSDPGMPVWPRGKDSGMQREERGGREAASFQMRLYWSFLLLPLCLETNCIRRERGVTPERQGTCLLLCPCPLTVQLMVSSPGAPPPPLSPDGATEGTVTDKEHKRVMLMGIKWGGDIPQPVPGDHLRWGVLSYFPIVLLCMTAESGQPKNNSHLCCASST